MSLAACPAKDSWWREFAEPREGSNNAPTNDKSSSGRRMMKGRGSTVQFCRQRGRLFLSSSLPWRRIKIHAITVKSCPGMSVLMGIPFPWLGLYHLVFASDQYGCSGSGSSLWFSAVFVYVWISSVPPTYHTHPAAAWLSRSRDCRPPGLILLRPSALITQHTHAHTCKYSAMSWLWKPREVF